MKKVTTSDQHLKNNYYLDWDNIENLVKKTALKIKKNNNKKYDLIIGIKNGGIIPAILISRELNINDIEFITIRKNKIFKFNKFHKDKKYLLIIDEIYDTGKTFSIVNEYFKRFEYDYACLISRYRIPDNNKIVTGKVLNHKRWIVFPWENG
ncbi:MAG TPA: phosphoribosyltransferase family protein [Nitrososphaeraceae archaeon]|nr:phosphoribosyltransferase family protein [Nitrososphaeraceae archaeon]